ncbi:MAG TPA: transposase, partial [Fervidobacterium sp.]|nr:transposase [Fervidobacterium sp.]
MQKRKVYSPEFKLNVVKEYLNGGKSPTQLCEKYSISPSIF